jgi:ABC-type branched-subunit amino acid transport system ATPase component
LSGGERRALEIGRSLMLKPRLVLMDEPSVGLSPILVREVFQQLRELRDAAGLTFLMIEQNARSGLELSDRGYVVERGRVTYSGAGEQLLADAEVRKTFLGV